MCLAEVGLNSARISFYIYLLPWVAPNCFFPNCHKDKGTISSEAKSTNSFLLWLFSEEELVAARLSVAILNLPVALPLFIIFDGGEWGFKLQGQNHFPLAFGFSKENSRPHSLLHLLLLLLLYLHPHPPTLSSQPLNSCSLFIICPFFPYSALFL